MSALEVLVYAGVILVVALLAIWQDPAVYAKGGIVTQPNDAPPMLIGERGCDHVLPRPYVERLSALRCMGASAGLMTVAQVLERLRKLGLDVVPVDAYSQPSWLAQVLLRKKPEVIGADYYCGTWCIGFVRKYGDSTGGETLVHWDPIVDTLLRGEQKTATINVDGESLVGPNPKGYRDTWASQGRGVQGWM